MNAAPAAQNEVTDIGFFRNISGRTHGFANLWLHGNETPLFCAATNPSC